MHTSENQYLGLLKELVEKGSKRMDRTGVGTSALFGRQIRFYLSEGFPLLTTKKMHLKGIIAELLWFLSGDTNERTLSDQGVNIWKEWAPENGDLGRVYGAQWRDWKFAKDYGPAADGGLRDFGISSIDQISELIKGLKGNPFSRRHIVTAWNPGELDQMALPPCHCLFQFFVEEVDRTCRERILFEKGTEEQWLEYRSFQREDVRDLFLTECGIPKLRLSCQLYQRSADIFLGVPYNIASYALLTQMVAQCVDMIPGDFVHTFGDVHLYNNHVEQAAEQLRRAPRPFPTMHLNPAVKDIFGFSLDDFTLEGYEPHSAIKAPVAV